MMKTLFSPDAAVSVILPTYNREKTLGHAIESVIRQSFSDWELLVIDDGSTDGTPALVDTFMHAGWNLRYMKHANRGAALSRNAGIQASFGRYITFLDSDDHYLPEHLASRLAIIKENPETALLSGGFCGDDDIYVTDRMNPAKKVHIRECVLCGTFFGKREVFFSLGGFRDLDYAEDADLWERASALYGTRKIASPETYVYSRAGDSITRNR